MSWNDKFSEDAKSIRASEIRELLKILEDPAILSFAGGIPDPALFPMEQVKNIRAEIESQPELDRQRRMALGGLRREKYLPSSASLIAVQHAKSVRQHVVARKTAVKSDKVVAACVAAGRVGSLASVVPSSVWGLS